MMYTHMQNLSETHRRLAPVCLHQSIGIIEGPARPHDDLHTRLFRQPDDLRISLLRIRIRIFLKHQMRGRERFEQLREQGLRRFADQ